MRWFTLSSRHPNLTLHLHRTNLLQHIPYFSQDGTVPSTNFLLDDNLPSRNHFLHTIKEPINNGRLKTDKNIHSNLLWPPKPIPAPQWALFWPHIFPYLNCINHSGDNLCWLPMSAVTDINYLIRQSLTLYSILSLPF